MNSSGPIDRSTSIQNHITIGNEPGRAPFHIHRRHLLCASNGARKLLHLQVQVIIHHGTVSHYQINQFTLKSLPSHASINIYYVLWAVVVVWYVLCGEAV